MAKLALVISLLFPLLTPVASQVQKAKGFSGGRVVATGPQWTLADYDIRRGQAIIHTQGPTKPQLAALKPLQEQVKGLEIRFDPVTSALHHLFSLSQRLTAPRSGDPVTIARQYLKTHRDLFRLESREIDDWVVAKNYRTEHNGLTHVVFKQFWQGLDVFQGNIKVNMDRRGQILSINGNYFPGAATSLTPNLSATEAVQRAASSIDPVLVFTPTLKAPPAGVEQATIFDRGPFNNDITANLVIFPAHDRPRLGWKVRLHLMERRAWYDTVVDAQTGEILFRYNLYKFSDPGGMVFAIHPDAGPQVRRSFAGDPTASPSTWVSPSPNTGTQGNNVITLPLALNPTQQFDFPFGNIYNTDGGNAFDLDRQTLRFTPNGAGGYDVSLSPLSPTSFDHDLGSSITSRVRPDRDDGSVLFPVGFSFPFFDSSYNTIFINANGNITFTGASRSAAPSWAEMIGSPRIAALWADLDLGPVPDGGGLFLKKTTDRLVITWNKAPQFNLTDSNTVQLTLFTDGTIQITFNGVALKDGMVGLSSGKDPDLRPVDFSATAPLTGSHSGVAERFPAPDLNAVVTNVFYHLNFMHDHLYSLGFDETAGNFQLNNFGRGGLGNDPVSASPQDAGFNNAFFATPEDGQAPFTAYFLFTSPPFRQADSAVDADVMYHEYTHGLTTRLVGNPFDVNVLNSFQSGAMGEGWSDAYACSLTNDPILGEYSTGNAETGIRDVNYGLSPLVYGDFGNRSGPLTNFQITGGIALDKTFRPEVHEDGEIWATTLWDLRRALGKEPFEQVVTDALKLTPSNPSMLDARDAILLADVASNGGAHQAAIWTVFAARGMGVSARSDNGDDTIIFQAFDTPWNRLLPERETIFFDSMSSGMNGWTVAGDSGNGMPALWHLSNRRGSAWYYGREETGTYNSGARNFGALTSPAIPLPAILRNSAIVLEFDHFLRTQDLFSTLRDNGYVRVVDPATGEVTQVAFVNNNTVGSRGGDSFQHEQINLSPFAGRTIQIQFYFDTINASANDAEGWYIDNVHVSRRVR
jgi:hypothetical protein